MKKLYGRIFNIDPDEKVVVWMNWQNPDNFETETITEWIYFKQKMIPTLILAVTITLIIIFTK